MSALGHERTLRHVRAILRLKITNDAPQVGLVHELNRIVGAIPLDLALASFWPPSMLPRYTQRKYLHTASGGDSVFHYFLV